jgi:hypothetical protein
MRKKFSKISKKKRAKLVEFTLGKKSLSKNLLIFFSLAIKLDTPHFIDLNQNCDQLSIVTKIVTH